MAETVHHFGEVVRATAEPSGGAGCHELVCDIRGDGVLHSSVRRPEGLARALFWRDCIELPLAQARQFRYGWDGNRMHRHLAHGTRAWTTYPPEA